jgi:hypothetical protein
MMSNDLWTPARREYLRGLCAAADYDYSAWNQPRSTFAYLRHMMNRYYDPQWLSCPSIEDPYSLRAIFEEINRDYRYYGRVQRQPLIGPNYRLGRE